MLYNFVIFAVIAVWVVDGSKGDQNVTVVDAGDPSVSYTQAVNSDLGQSWIDYDHPVCDHPQRLTRKIGDYASFTFQGTGIEVRGTIGKERGLIGISLDGQTTSFDRTSDTVECEFPLFQKYGLPRGQHTVIITLLARNQTLDNNGTMVGLLSLQHLRYTDAEPSNPNIGAIIGGVAGGVLFILTIVAFLWWFRLRRRQPKQATFLDIDEGMAERPEQSSYIPGAVVTPFSWQPAQTRRRDHSPARANGSSFSSDHSTNTDPRKSTSSRKTASSFDEKRRSHRNSNSTHTDNRRSVESSTSQSHRRTPDHSQWADTIALRLADLMQNRLGNPGGVQESPPPLYDANETHPIASNLRTMSGPT